jgi:LPS-assembly lipoprotein
MARTLASCAPRPSAVAADRPPMRRRALLGLGAATLLAGCGFQLRQAPDFAFDALVMNASPSSPLAAELSRSLASNGRVKVLPATAIAAPSAAAAAASAGARATPAPNQVIFDLPQELREKIVVGLNSSGQVREFQLRTRIRFRLRTPQGKELIPETELVQQRDITFNEAAVLAKEAEESLLYRDMQADLVQQLMRRLAAIKSL